MAFGDDIGERADRGVAGLCRLMTAVAATGQQLSTHGTRQQPPRNLPEPGLRRHAAAGCTCLPHAADCSTGLPSKGKRRTAIAANRSRWEVCNSTCAGLFIANEHPSHALLRREVVTGEIEKLRGGQIP